MFRIFRRSRQPDDAAAAPDGVAEAVPEEPDDAARLEEVEQRTEAALARTKRSWFGHITGLFERGDIDEALWEELEELLIGADVGVTTTQKVLDRVRDRVEQDGVRQADEVRAILRDTLVDILEAPEGTGKLWRANGARGAPPRPAVILVLGVNGTGKTTTIAKLAHAALAEGQRAIVAAGDTFRAAAIDQLREWGARLDVDVIAHKQGADPGAVVFDALEAAKSRNADVVIIDTAGRLHTKFNLMEELRKIRRVIERYDPSAPHEALLVLDATTGQNALIQAQAFTDAVEVTSVCLTKLDGSSKGGIVFAVCDQLGIPVRFVGTGERPEDLTPFSPSAFVDALFR